MNAVTENIHFYMYHFWNIHGDLRAKDYFIYRYGLYLPTLVLGSYFIFVTTVGPKIMQHRKAFTLKWTLLVYNFLMVVMNMYFFIQFLANYKFGLAVFEFEFPRRDDFSEVALLRTRLMHYYLLSKFAELLDTIFFVLRKKQNQVTKMHLYHHTSVAIYGWFVFRTSSIIPTVVIFCIFNSLIHSIMYSYYALAALGPAIQPYLWWKKYVTLLQIYQFVILTVYSLVFAYKQVNYPTTFQLLAYTQPILFLVLFLQFYFSTYTPNKVRVAKLQD